MLYFATLFDKNYLSRGLTLYESLQKHSSDEFVLFVLALDEEVISYFSKKPEFPIRVITLTDIENAYPELLIARGNRSKVEYYFTLSPYLPSYILALNDNIDRITTLDCDLYFFDDPTLIFQAYPDASVLITPHNFTPVLKKMLKYGRYNVSFQAFKNDANGLACLASWRKNCLEWCYDVMDSENNRFADQRYLDSWSSEFENVEAITLDGTGIAPWNLDNHFFEVRKGKLFVNDKPLIYCHFHHLRIFNTYFAINAFKRYKVKKVGKGIKKMYKTYLNHLAKTSRKIIFTDHALVRYAAPTQRRLFRKLRKNNGFWMFSRWFIFFVNFSRKR